jgi:hypothetical protein
VIVDMNIHADGIDHINVYSKGRTELGRFLTNFAYCPIVTEDGPFNSIEGYWGWLGLSENNPVREQLRTLYGWQAKKLKDDQYKNGDPGRFDENFEAKIAKAVLLKMHTDKAKNILRQNQALLDLPLEHYYCFGPDDNPKVIDVKRKYQFLIDSIAAAISDVKPTL